MRLRKLATTTIAAAALASLPVNAFALEAAAATSLNVRAGPGTGYMVIDTLAPGQIVEVNGCNLTNTWCEIHHWGRDGWVAADYLTKPNRSLRQQPAASNSNDGLAVLLFGAAVIGTAILAGSQHSQPPRNNRHHSGRHRH